MSTRKLNLEVILVNLNIHGLQLRHLLNGLNIHLVKMLFFVYHAFSLTSQLGILGVTYSLRTDFRIGRKLMMEIIVPFWIIYGKNLTLFIDQIASNQLRLKASIDVVKVLAFQGLAFRGRDESSGSINRGNFLEILDLVLSYNEYVA